MANTTEAAIEELPATAPISALNCIDLSSSDLRNSASILRQACLGSGFFYVINHGISQEFLDEVFAQSKKFFNLPLEEKMKLLRNEKNRGYTPILDEILDPDNQIQGDYKEGYYIGIEVPADDPRAEKQFYGQNVWPMADILPGWRETMERYHREALEVARAVARIIALALELDSDFFDKPEILGRISEPTKGIYGAGAHTDFGMLTLLAADNVTGLQICNDKNAKPQVWEYVPPLKGAFIVNLGDLLERLTNCIFRPFSSAIEHLWPSEFVEEQSLVYHMMSFYVIPSYNHSLNSVAPLDQSNTFLSFCIDTFDLDILRKTLRTNSEPRAS